MKLRRCIALHWPCSVMFKLRHGKLGRRFSWMVPADPRLRVPLQFVKRDAHAFTVRFAYSLIAADKSSKRNGFRSRKRGVPACAMLHRLDGFPVLVFVFVRHAVLNKLLASLRVLSLA